MSLVGVGTRMTEGDQVSRYEDVMVGGVGVRLCKGTRYKERLCARCGG